MLFKLGMLALNGLICMFGVERKLGAGAGPAKKKEVLRVVEEQARNLELAGEAGACDLDDIMQIIADLVDNVVALLNCFGLLGGKK